jgi:phosphoserine phosphatase
MALKKFKLVAFDMDGTLIKQRSSWAKVNEYFGTAEGGETSLKKYSEGKITYTEFMHRDISAWPKNLNINDIKKILSDFEFFPGIKQMMIELKEMNLITAMISSGISCLANIVSEELNMDYCYANDLDVDENGFLTGIGIENVVPSKKGDVLKKLVNKLNIDSSSTIAVGDTRYDLSMITYAEVGVSVGNDEVLMANTDFHLNNLNVLPLLIRRLDFDA